MGTRYSVKLAGPLADEARQRAAAAIEAELARVDELMSTWRDDSELSRFNRQPPGEPFRVSQETAEVLATARRVAELSGGAFDVTAGALVRAWGCGPEPRVPMPPTADALAAARAGVGRQLVDLDRLARTLTRRRPETTLDLSGIAPGFAADRVAAALAALGHRSVLVDVGGEIKAVGRRPDGSPWRVGVTSGGELAVTVPLDDLALATSGDERNFYVDDTGTRRSHIVDPRSGEPVSHALASATVVHRRAADADALATALMVLGPRDGLGLAEREGLAAYFVIRGGDGRLETRETRGFAALRSGRP
jgi:thiamine biosynthesis lipoprotein